MTTSQTKQGTMRAWAIPAYGGPERMQLMELPVPQVGAGDVLIRMRGAEVGDWDALVREGEWPMERGFPLVLGLAGAGTVAAAGELVSGIAKGDRVYAYNYPMQHPGCESPDHNGAWTSRRRSPRGRRASTSSATTWSTRTPTASRHSPG
jgi:NADPH:quinone reductase-like Zn-dependent oxidoreductase